MNGFIVRTTERRDGRIAREKIAYFHMLSDVIFSSCKFSEIGLFLKVYIVKTKGGETFMRDFDKAVKRMIKEQADV